MAVAAMRVSSLQTSFRFGAHAAHPLPGIVDLGMIFRLPDWLGSVKQLQQPHPLDIALRQLDKKRSPLPVRDDLVDLGNHFRWVGDQNSIPWHGLYLH